MGQWIEHRAARIAGGCIFAWVLRVLDAHVPPSANLDSPLEIKTAALLGNAAVIITVKV